MPFSGRGACTTKPPLHPQPSLALGHAAEMGEGEKCGSMIKTLSGRINNIGVGLSDDTPLGAAEIARHAKLMPGFSFLFFLFFCVSRPKQNQTRKVACISSRITREHAHVCHGGVCANKKIGKWAEPRSTSTPVTSKRFRRQGCAGPRKLAALRIVHIQQLVERADVRPRHK